MLTFLFQLKRRAATCYESFLPSAGTRPDDIGQEGLALLAKAHIYVPPCTELDDDIKDMLGGQNSRAQTEYLYNQHVLEKLDSQEQQLLLDINGHEVSEADFVKWFRPTGEMDPRALRIQFILWNHEWKAQNKPYFIVPEAHPHVSTFFCKIHLYFFVFTNTHLYFYF